MPTWFAQDPVDSAICRKSAARTRMKTTSPTASWRVSVAIDCESCGTAGGFVNIPLRPEVAMARI
jgi:hypothetical protein